MKKSNSASGITDVSEMKSFARREDAISCYKQGNKVVYFGHVGGAVGKFTSYAGSFFSFKGKDSNGVEVSVRDVHFERFRPMTGKLIKTKA